jgi:hypothetical protein
VDQSEVEALVARQSEFLDDWERLEAYGRTIPEVWREAQFDGRNLVAYLTDPDTHRARLLDLVQYSDRLTVRRAPYSRQALKRIEDEVFEAIGRDSGLWKAVGPALDHVEITLRADQSALAERLHAQFGDVLQITLGQHRFPLPRSEPSLPRPAPAPTVEIPDLTLTIQRSLTRFPGHVLCGDHAADAVVMCWFSNSTGLR